MTIIYGGGGINYSLFSRMLEGIPEYFLINSYYVFPNQNGVDWYIQQLFLASIPTYWLLKNHRDLTCKVIATVVPLITLSYLIRMYGNLEGYMSIKGATVSGLVNWSLFRVEAGLLLGILAWECSRKVSSRYSSLVASLLFLLVILCSWKYGHTRYDFFYVNILALAIALGFSGEMKCTGWTSPCVVYLSNLCLFIYLNHYSFRVLLRENVASWSVGLMVTYVVAITLFSIFMHFILIRLKMAITFFGKECLKHT